MCVRVHGARVCMYSGCEGSEGELGLEGQAGRSEDAPCRPAPLHLLLGVGRPCPHHLVHNYEKGRGMGSYPQTPT